MPLSVLIVIPCYNEEASLPQVLRELLDLPISEDYKITPLVINDCSKDRTVAVAKDMRVNLLDLPCNLGIGGAVQTGIIYAFRNDFDLAVQMDGDGQHPPHELYKLLDAYRDQGADVVIGSLFLDKKGFQSSLTRRLGIRYFYRLNKILTGNSVYDSTSGFRLLSKKAIALASRQYPDDYPEPESLILFSKAGLSVQEVPVLMRARLGGSSSISHGASLFYCIKVTLAMLFSYIRD